jgi:hypothetical protein
MENAFCLWSDSQKVSRRSIDKELQNAALVDFSAARGSSSLNPTAKENLEWK